MLACMPLGGVVEVYVFNEGGGTLPQPIHGCSVFILVCFSS